MKILENYIFKGFGFDVLLKNVKIKMIDGEEYPAINLNELKNIIAKNLLSSKHRLTGNQLKFVRTYLQLSLDNISEKIHIPSSTLRSWENKGSEFTGFSLEQEKAFRIFAVNYIFDQEKTKLNIEVSLIKEFDSIGKDDALDLSVASNF